MGQGTSGLRKRIRVHLWKSVGQEAPPVNVADFYQKKVPIGISPTGTFCCCFRCRLRHAAGHTQGGGNRSQD